MTEDDSQSEDDSPSRSISRAAKLGDPSDSTLRDSVPRNADSNDAAIDLYIRIDDDGWTRALPQAEALVEGAVAATLSRFENGPVDLSVVLATDADVQALNAAYRKKNAPTNVLSFPASPISTASKGATTNGSDATEPLGDVILALETVEREAEEQGKSVGDHLSHLVVHGVLHLLGLDHRTADEAEDMESLERLILDGLGIADPYSDSDPATEDGKAA